MTLFIFAETDQQAIEYARKNKFRPGTFHVLSRVDAMRRFKFTSPPQALLVGRVERRHDYEDLMATLQEFHTVVNRIALSA